MAARAEAEEMMGMGVVKQYTAGGLRASEAGTVVHQSRWVFVVFIYYLCVFFRGGRGVRVVGNGA